MTAILLSFVLIGIFGSVLTVERWRPENQKKLSKSDAQEYLHKFLYLPPLNLVAAGHAGPSLASAREDLKKAIMQFQKTADIPQTGILDDETRTVMAQPRCGVPDIAMYTLGRAPLKWKKNALTYSIDSYSQDLSSSIQKKTVQEAFQFWAAVSPLTFREVAREGDIREFGLGITGTGK
ncbi:unnamed protein product, partial [Mesorhabditis spiculigera]